MLSISVKFVQDGVISVDGMRSFLQEVELKKSATVASLMKRFGTLTRAGRQL